jgi:hypothetical protein
VRRRALLRAAALALPTALAGCAGSGSGGGSADDPTPAPPAFVREVGFDGPDVVVRLAPDADVTRVALTRLSGDVLESASVPPSGVVRLPVVRPAEFVSHATALHSLSFETPDGAVEYGVAPVAHVDVRSLRPAPDGRPGSVSFVVANTGEVPVMLRDVLVGGEAPSPVEAVETEDGDGTDGVDERPPPGWPHVVAADPAARPSGVVRHDLVLPVGAARRFRTTYAPLAADDAAACDGRERVVDATAHLVSGSRIGYSFRVVLDGEATPVAGAGGEEGKVVCADVLVRE